MCGIAGIWGTSEQTLVSAMIDKQSHRGPDGRGVHVQQLQGVLGHARLAIMDPVQGQQPIYNETRTATIVANGEVYNHEKLRQRLKGPHQFSTTSDSESVLHFFEEQCLSTAQHLDGMFAFAVARDDGLFLARDPIGIKPLYYGFAKKGQPEETFFFASELKALSDWADEIHEFPPGTYYHSKKGFRPYYSVPENIPSTDVSIETHIQNVRKTLEKAVTKRLMSDVPLGAFLSGGLDSSIIAAIARQHKSELHTFSVGIEGSRDLLAARRVSEYIGSIHHEYSFTTEEVLERLPEIVYYLESFDRDLVRSAIPTYFCARMAAEYVKVILTGEGADELFAGYTYHKSIANADDLHDELHRSVGKLHNINLQRVDRMTMRHSIEGRVPFLDTSLIEVAQTIPANLKLLRSNGSQPVEKWILRKAVEDLLPHDIVWRNKEQFDEGSGTVDMLQEVIRTAASGIDPLAYAAQYPDATLKSAEECFYHTLLVGSFSRPEVVLPNVARWPGQIG